MEQARLLSFILVKQLSQVKSEQTNELNVKSLKSFWSIKVIVNKDNNLSPETQLHSFFGFFHVQKNISWYLYFAEQKSALWVKTCMSFIEILFTYI